MLGIGLEEGGYKEPVERLRNTIQKGLATGANLYIES